MKYFKLNYALVLFLAFAGCASDVVVKKSNDYAEAVKSHRKTAEQGNPEAQYYLGVMYYEGIGVPQDYAEGITDGEKEGRNGR